MQVLALLVQKGVTHNPDTGDLFVSHGCGESQIGWYDGIGTSRFAKPLEKIWFVGPAAKEGAVSLTPLQLACLLGWTVWRKTQYT